MISADRAHACICISFPTCVTFSTLSCVLPPASRPVSSLRNFDKACIQVPVGSTQTNQFPSYKAFSTIKVGRTTLPSDPTFKTIKVIKMQHEMTLSALSEAGSSSSSGGLSSTLTRIAIIGIGTFTVGMCIGTYLGFRSSSEGAPSGRNDEAAASTSKEGGEGVEEEVKLKKGGSRKEPLEVEKLADVHEDFKMVLCVRNDLKMGKGKVAAQCSHATLGLYKKILKRAPKALARWEESAQVKVVLRLDTEEDMLLLQSKAKAAGIPTHITVDAGRTQIAPNSRTVMSVLGPVDIVDDVTGHLKLL
eukprot:jgi/Mesen1/2214/ME000152S01305